MLSCCGPNEETGFDRRKQRCTRVSIQTTIQTQLFVQLKCLRSNIIFSEKVDTKLSVAKLEICMKYFEKFGNKAVAVLPHYRYVFVKTLAKANKMQSYSRVSLNQFIGYMKTSHLIQKG